MLPFNIDTRVAQRLVDLGVLSVAFWAAFLLRFDAEIPYWFLKRALFLWPYVVFVQYLVLVIAGVPRFFWRYVGLREAIRIGVALAATSGGLFVVRLAVGGFAAEGSVFYYLFIPIGVVAIDFVLAFLGVVGVRVLRRVMHERSEANEKRAPTRSVRTLLIGAGRAGMSVAKEIAQRPDLGIEPVGFVDNNPEKQGAEMHGLRVLGTFDDLPSLVDDRDVEQALITIANAPGSEVRRIKERCEAIDLPVKIVPHVYDILDGRVNLQTIRDVSIEDLLRREVVELEEDAIIELVTGRTVLVTGAGGSIGSEICRQVSRFNPSRLLLAERAEPSLFDIHRELLRSWPGARVVPLLCDVCDHSRIDTIFAAHDVDVVFHAAAHKHVPMAERNPGEAAKNNIFGTKTVADAAHRHGTSEFVLISTDKAVNPTSVMGTTKRVAEMYIQALSQRSDTKYVAVRFGNVLGSAGSVVPIFREQIRRGGPVTVTHPEMKRYFMTIPEATQLVVQAGAMGAGGEIFALDMGEPVRIVDLANDLITLSGFRPGDSIDVVFSGVRPGEKLFEELGFDPERMEKTRHAKIFIGKLRPEEWDTITSRLDTLRPHLDSDDSLLWRGLLTAIVPEMIADARDEKSSGKRPSGRPERPTGQLAESVP